MRPDEIEFLKESNAIEGVYNEMSLEDAKRAWKFLIGQGTMTLKVIKRTHEILMRNQYLSSYEVGHFRQRDVWVGSKRMLTPTLIHPNLLMEFCLPTMRVSPKPDWQALHVKYEAIHPFIDGNGRTGRMFLNWTRVRRCKLPVLVIKEAERFDYYKWFV